MSSHLSPAGLISLGCCALQFLIYRALPRVRRTPGWLVLRAALCEAAVSCCFIALYFSPAPEPAAALPDTSAPLLLARPWGVLLALCFFEACATGWRVLIYFELLNIYRNPFAPDRHRVLYAYPIAVLLFGAGVTAGCYLYANTV